MRASPEFSSCRLHHLHTKYDHDSKLGDRPDLTPTSLLVGLAQGGDALLCIPVLESARIATLSSRNRFNEPDPEEGIFDRRLA
ncbi:hypothetical protein TrVGV298_001913 [Trichoderma virens]|nr:hypothetical protein TrVGV298_001913 [Trichoderma virens]